MHKYTYIDGSFYEFDGYMVNYLPTIQDINFPCKVHINSDEFTFDQERDLVEFLLNYHDPDMGVEI